MAETAGMPRAAPTGVGTPDASVVTALVERAQSGDRTAFEELIERRVDGAYRTARAILGNEADARDATQDAFLDAWRARTRLRDPVAQATASRPVVDIDGFVVLR